MFMECFCKHKETDDLKVEGDVGADPIWCNKCGCNFDIEEVSISDGLKEEVMRWAMMYGEWIDWHKDTLRPNGIELENKHKTEPISSCGTFLLCTKETNGFFRSTKSHEVFPFSALRKLNNTKTQKRLVFQPPMII